MVVGVRPFVGLTFKFHSQFLLSLLHGAHHVDSDFVDLLLWVLTVVLHDDLELLLVVLALVLHLDYSH